MRASRIRLSRIIALNWYGFRTIIDVRGLTLLCGETGTGKSALLDLIQFVMCPSAAKFNKAAAGESNARDLRGYCLCDTNTRDRGSGQPRFLRRNGASIAALEFEWPAPKDGSEPRRETWGIRVEFESPTAQATYVRFFAPIRLEKEDLCDEGGDLLTEDSFKMRIKRELQGDSGFTTHKAFLDEMAVPTHLHFDPGQMRKTLPKAIAFELDSDYQRFIRDFILERDDLDVSSAKSTLAALRETEQRVVQLREQFDILTRIDIAHTKYAEARREEAIFRHLRYALDHAEAAEKVERNQFLLDDLHTKHRDNVAAMECVVRDKSDAKERYTALRLTGGKEDVDLNKLEALHAEHKQKTSELDELRNNAKSVREFLADRANAWEHWLRHAAALDWKVDVDAQTLAALRSDETAKALDAVAKCIGIFYTVWNESETKLKPIAEEIARLETRSDTLEKQLRQIEHGSTAPTPLLDALRRMGVRADTLGRILEISVAGEPWWGVIEALLGDERRAVLVNVQHDFLTALDLWRETPGAETLINPSEITHDGTQAEFSLASLLETEHPIARRFLDARLGKFAAVKSIAELEKHTTGAATPEGLINEPPMRRRIVPEKEFTLGEKGLRRLQEIKGAELAEVTTRLRDLRQRRDDVHAWLNCGKEARLNQDDRPRGSSELYRVPELERSVGTIAETIKIISRPDLEDRLRQMGELEKEVERQDQRIGELKGPITDFETRKNKLTEDLNSSKEDHDIKVADLQASRARMPAGILDTELAERLQNAINSEGNWRTKRDMAEIAENEWREQANQRREERSSRALGSEIVRC